MTESQKKNDNAINGATAEPTKVRLLVVLFITAMSILLYLDRFCVSFAADFIKEDLQLTQSEVSYFLSAFFFSYALAQVPAGWFSDRFGARVMLAIYILAWSVFTALISAVHSLALLLITRMACGLGQAGAYPTSASVISKWVPFRKRGAASAWISLGGRLGGAIAPLLTAYLIVLFVPLSTPVEFTAEGLLDARQLALKIGSEGDVTSDVGPHVWSLLNGDNQKAVREVAQQGESDDTELTDEQTSQLLTAVNGLLDSQQLYSEAPFRSAKLSREAIGFLKRQQAGESLSEVERRRFNRLLLEAGFPGEISKIYVQGWRPVMFVYGGAGLFVAGLFWLIHRNRPEEHPWCNEAECELIAAGRPANAPSPHGKPGMVPFWRILKSGSLWLDCFGQFGTNIGWIFLVTWLPRYLISQHQVPILERGMMAMTPLLVGSLGTYCGGWLTDILTHHLGVRWGRRLPLAVTRFMAAAGYGLCLWFSTFPEGSAMNSPWMFVAALSLVSFSTDLGVPAGWAFKQDVGGRYVGSILGWGNMWGNLGATVSPIIYNYFLGESPGPAEWNAMFWVCLTGFVFAGLCGMGIDASKSVAPPDDDDGGAA